MNKIKFYLIALIVLVSGCAPQPSEEQKQAVEKEMLGCLFSVNETLDDETSPLEGVLNVLGGITDNPSFDEKTWSLDKGKESLNDTVTVEFNHKGNSFSCALSLNADAEYEIQSVVKNSIEIFNRAENDKIKEQKAILKEAKRVEEIKQWKEKTYSNASYKYYQKRHIDSASEFEKPTLNVVCNPKNLQVEFDDGKIRFNGRENIEFIFEDNQKLITKKAFNLTAGGTIGVQKKTVLGNEIEYDFAKTHEFLDLLESSILVSVDGVSFNIDDANSVPCLETRKEDLAREKKKFSDYLALLEKSAGDYVSKDELTNETTYLIYGETESIGDDIFGRVGSQVMGIVVFKNTDLVSSESFEVTWGTKQRAKYDDILGGMKLIFMDGDNKNEIVLNCNYDFAGRSKSAYGYSNEFCEPSSMKLSELASLGNADKVRVSAKGYSFDSLKSTEIQKLFISDLIRIAKVISPP